MMDADGLWSTLTYAIFFNTGYSNVESHNRKFYKNQTFSNFHTTVTFYFDEIEAVSAFICDDLIFSFITSICIVMKVLAG